MLTFDGFTAEDRDGKTILRRLSKEEFVAKAMADSKMKQEKRQLIKLDNECFLISRFCARHWEKQRRMKTLGRRRV